MNPFFHYPLMPSTLSSGLDYLPTEVPNPFAHFGFPFLQTLPQENPLDGRFAYKAFDADIMQSEPAPPLAHDRYAALLDTPVVIQLKYGEVSYVLQTKAGEHLEWVNALATAAGILIAWRISGTALDQVVGSAFLTDTFQSQHPQQTDMLGRLKDGKPLESPLIARFSARCLYTNEARSLGDFHVLNIVYEHFRVLEFELEFSNGSKQRAVGFEAFCQTLVELDDPSTITFATISNFTVPWMSQRRWDTRQILDLADSIKGRGEEFRTLQAPPSTPGIPKIFEELTPWLFGISFAEFKTDIEKSLASNHLSQTFKRVEGKALFLYTQLAFGGDQGQTFDFRYFNSYVLDDETFDEAEDKIYLEFPKNSLDFQKGALRWSKQAILYKICKVVSLMRQGEAQPSPRIRQSPPSLKGLIPDAPFALKQQLEPPTPIAEQVEPPEPQPPPPNPVTDIKSLFGQFDSPAFNPDYGLLLESCAAATSIPRLKAMFRYFKAKTLTAQEIEFHLGLYRILCERGMVRKCHNLFSRLILAALPQTLGSKERAFWIEMTRTHMQATDVANAAPTVFNLLELLESRCHEGREAVEECLHATPVDFIEAEPGRYGTLLLKFKTKGKEGFKDFFVKNLKENSPQSLNRLIQLLTAQRSPSPLQWHSVFYAAVTNPSLEVVSTCLERITFVLKSWNSAERPQERRAFRALQFRLCFRIYKGAPTPAHYQLVMTQFNSLKRGDNSFDSWEAYDFLTSFLVEFKDHPFGIELLPRLQEWYDIASCNTARDQSQLDLDYGAIVTRQRLPANLDPKLGQIYTECLCEALINFIDVLEKQKNAPFRYLEQALDCYKRLCHKDFSELTPYLGKLSVLMLERMRAEPAVCEAVVCIDLLLKACRNLKDNQQALRDSLLATTCQLAEFALEHQRDSCNGGKVVQRFNALMQSIYDKPQFLLKASTIVAQLAGIMPVLHEPFYRAIVQKQILNHLAQESFNAIVPEVAEAFETVEALCVRKGADQASTQSLKALWVKYRGPEGACRGTAQELVEAAILANLKFLTAREALIPAKIYGELEKSLDKVFEPSHSARRELKIPSSCLNDKEFLKHLLELRVSSLSSAWLLLTLGGQIFRALSEDREQQDALYTLVGKFCLHPSLQHEAIKGQLNAQALSLLTKIQRDQFVPTKSTTQISQLHFYLTGQPLPTVKLDEKLQRAIFNNVIQTLRQINTPYSVNKAKELEQRQE